MGIDALVARLVFAFIFALILIWIVRPAILIIGTVTCPNCNPFLNAMFFIVIPIAIVFIGIYRIMEIFASRRGV